MTQTNIPAIPTYYNGTNYRSRLEARWAAFFEQIGWEYIYEPFDGDGYIPDFAILNRNRPLIVEIKPAITPDEYVTAAKKVYTGLESHYSEWDFLILGANPYHQSYNNVSAGLYCCPNHPLLVAVAAWWIFQEPRHPNSIYIKPSFIRTGRVSGEQVHTGELDKLWRKAGNIVQWHGKRV